MEKGEMGENATGRLTTYYVAECMEFNRYGEYREDIHSAEEAVKIYQSIPSERLNAGKGIGLHVEEEDGIPLEFSLVYNGELDVDLLRDIYDQNQYPEVFIAARELSAYLPETKVIDTKGLLTEKTLEATVFADEMIKLEKNLDPDFYHTFYPKEAEHKEAIIWKALCQDGKEEYSRWLGSKIFEQKSELKEQADKLKTTLEQVKLIPPVDLKPFVYVRISEHPDIPLEEAIEDIIPEGLMDDNTNVYVNPTGRFVIGGPHGDSGVTGRKIIVDTYGGCAHHGGGAFSGKDCTKVDRSAAYMARYLAKNIVAVGLAEKCEVQLSYAIGIANPVSVNVNTFGTGKKDDELLAEFIYNNFDLTPSGIIDIFKLRRPIYEQVASYGHFGRTELNLPWEQLDTKKFLGILEV